MAMDFFERQDQARRQTSRLLVLFGFAVATIIAIVYVALTFIANLSESPRTSSTYRSHGHRYVSHHGWDSSTVAIGQPTYWRPELLFYAVGGTLLVVGAASLYKIAELSAGGETVALMLGGRSVNPQSHDLAERRLLNIVEEMALASGVPVPPVFVLENERSINAFAAGHQPGDAVVAVSAGCLKYLTRDELQGVIAHEFSHILNGDMRLNLRLIGALYGILVLAIIGYYCMRTASLFGSDNSKGSKAAFGVFVLGLALVILGYTGVFFGKWIKCAINRQREYLADASSVQFTRNPDGIAGALKKIGGLTIGSRIADAHAEEVSHMFFGDAFAGSFFNIFASHPPLDERIRALDPGFDGKYPEVTPVTVEDNAVQERPSPHPKPPRSALAGLVPGQSAGGLVGAAVAASALNATGSTSGEAADLELSQPDASPLPPGAQLLARLPGALVEAAKEPFLAQAVIYSLLLCEGDATTRAKQLELLRGRITPALYQHTDQFAAAAQNLSAALRLPLVDLSLPALKNFSQQQYEQFRETISSLMTAEGKIDLFEYSLQMVLFSYLDIHFQVKKTPAVHYRTVRAVEQPLAIILSTLAYAGHDSPEAVQIAFQNGAKSLSLQAALQPKEQCSLKAFDAAIATLAQSTPGVKRRILAAAMACTFADDKLTEKEYELIRAIAGVLGCPVSPNLAQSALA